MCRSQEEQDELGESSGESHVGRWLAHRLAHRHSCSAGGHGPSPPDAPALSFCFGGVAVLFYLKDRKREKNPNFQHWLPSSWKDAQLDRCQSIGPDVSSLVLLLGTQAKPEISLASWLRRQG